MSNNFEHWPHVKHLHKGNSDGLVEVASVDFRIPKTLYLLTDIRLLEISNFSVIDSDMGRHILFWSMEEGHEEESFERSVFIVLSGQNNHSRVHMVSVRYIYMAILLSGLRVTALFDWVGFG